MLHFILTVLLASWSAKAFDVSDCSCGFQDDQTSSIYTDGLILYFNETDNIDPAIFQTEKFAHEKEYGWNSRFKVGAKPENARFSKVIENGREVQALEMILDPADDEHLVNGASLQSTRMDIQHGVFEAAMRPARQWTGGSALSFGIHFNRSNGISVDFLNGDNPEDAQLTNLINGEWPAPNLVTNFSIMEEAGLQPWNTFNEVRFSWNDSAVEFHAADNMTRLAKKNGRTLPTAGQALKLNTWSTGDKTYGQGPPIHNATRSHVIWVRAFFNSSQMTESQHVAFDQRCAASPRCMTADTSLRGYTTYGPASQMKWKEPPKNKGIRTLAGIVAACCSSFGVFALMNIFFRRIPWQKLWPKKAQVNEMTDESSIENHTRCKKSEAVSTSEATVVSSGAQTPLPAYGAQTPRSGSHTPAPSYHTNAPSLRRFGSMASLATNDPSDRAVTPGSSQTDIRRTFTNTARDGSANARLEKALHRISEMSNFEKSDIEGLKSIQTLERTVEDIDEITPVGGPLKLSPSLENLDVWGLKPIKNLEGTFEDVDEIAPMDAVSKAAPMDEIQPITPKFVVTESGKQAVAAVKAVYESKEETQTTVALTRPLTYPAKRVDYLSGLTAVACISVTLHHFGQTFWPYVIEGHGPTAHYAKVEEWLHIFIGGIVLSNLWIGPFFLTATRFLSTNYLKHGNLEDIAKKELRRAPRLFVPIIVITLLEYFLISMGLTSSLQWLPSVTYSTWPFVVPQKNFAIWINNIVELAYMIPNAVPEINSHIPIGVLWTIPVQLQYTYVVLAATVVMRDIKNPWKRFSVYALVILAGWYARSWSACHWAGLVLSDLEATYQWTKRLRKLPLARYAVLTAASVSALGATMFSVFNHTWSFTTFENSIHPDQTTGKPIIANGAVYPDYSEPTLAILLFSIGLQIIVELSTWVQAFLSLRVFVFVNPMTFCIYLTHGFVMWTWGAWVSLACNSAGIPYWANLIVTLVTTYCFIFLSAWILTPLLEFPTQALLRNIDRWTKEEPIPKRPTTAPFSKDLVLNRKNNKSIPGDA